MGRLTCKAMVATGIMAMSVTATSPKYRTKYLEPPSPDWYLPIRQIMSSFYSTATTVEIWNNYEGSGPSDYGDMVDTFAGFLAVTIIGVCLALIALIALLCVSSYRCCCGNCGGTNRQSLKTCQKRPRLIVLSALLAITLAISLVPMGYMYSSLPMKSHMASNYVESLENNLDDFETYVNYSRKQIDDLIQTDIIDVLNVESMKILNFGNEIGPQLVTYVEQHSAVQVVLADLSNVADRIDGMQALLISLYNDTETVKDDVSPLNDSLQYLIAQLSNFVINCSQTCEKTPSPCNVYLCESVGDLADQASNYSLTALSINLTEPLQQLEKIVAKKLPETIANFKSSFENISSIVQNASRHNEQEIADLLQSAECLVVNSTKNLDSFFDKGVNSLATIHRKFRRDIDGLQVHSSDNNIFGYSLAISIVLSVIWVMYTSGLLGGLLVFDPKRPPTERNEISDFFGSLLSASAYTTLLVSALFWLVVASLSILGIGLDAFLCQPLFDDSFLLLDKLQNNFALTSFENSTFTISTALHSCQRNLSALQSFNIEIDVKASLYQNLQNLTNQWASINTSEWDLKLYPETFEDDLGQFKQAVTFDFTGYLNDTEMEMATISELKDNLLPALDDKLDSFESVVDLAYQAEVLKHLTSELYDSLKQFNDRLVHLRSSVAVWQSDANIVMDRVTYCLIELPNIDLAVKQGACQVVLNYGEDFLNTTEIAVSDLIESLNNEVGNCGQLWVIFQSFRVTTCRIVVDNINVFWFCLAFVLLLFTLAIVPAFKLSKYFRTMKEPSKKDERFQRSNVTKQINQAKNSHFNDDVDNFYLRPPSAPVPTVSSAVVDTAVPVPYPRNMKVQPIIMAFERRGSSTYAADVHRQGLYPALPDVVASKVQPAIRLSTDQFDLYKPIPRVATQTPTTRPSSSISSSLAPTEYESLGTPEYERISFSAYNQNQQPLYFEPIPSPTSDKQKPSFFGKPSKLDDRRYE